MTCRYVRPYGIATNVSLQKLDLSRKTHKITKSIGASARELLDLVEEFPDLVHAEIAGNNDDSIGGPMGLYQCAFTVAEMYQPEASDKGLELSLQLDELPQQKVIFNDDDLSQILVNLLGNAVKFTEQGGIELSAVSKQPQGATQMIEFAVSDTGIGIPPEQLETIFNPFSPSGAKSSEKFGGAGGLGLPLCKGLVELVGGEIWIESEVGKGTTVKFTFPVKLYERLKASIPG